MELVHVQVFPRGTADAVFAALFAALFDISKPGPA